MSVQGSQLRSLYEAPLDGYLSQWVQTKEKRPEQPYKLTKDDNRNFYIRVRTMLDISGNITNAVYGKIYGDNLLNLDVIYYLNPTPNDRNLEFNPKANLLKPEHSWQEVTEP